MSKTKCPSCNEVLYINSTVRIAKPTFKSLSDANELRLFSDKKKGMSAGDLSTKYKVSVRRVLAIIVKLKYRAKNK